MGVSEISDVMISYRRIDVDFVKDIVDGLQKHKKEVWIDWEDIPPGSVGFTDDIKKGIEGADSFIAILSPDYLKSQYCIWELEYALELNKKIIPIVHRKFEEYDIPAGIGHINWIYFTPHAGQANTIEESLPKIIEAMETDLEHQRAHKRFLLRAIEWKEHDKGNSFLLDGDEITQAEHWLADSAGKEPLPSHLHKDYIAYSREHETQRQRRLLAGVSGALILTILLAIFAGFQWRDATIAREDAEIARDDARDAQAIAEEQRDISNSLALASGARELMFSDQREAVGLALQATEIDNAPNLAQQVLSEIAYHPGTLAIYGGHSSEPVALTTNPDGTTLAISLGEDESGTYPENTILIYDIATGEILQSLEGHGGVAQGLAFSPDGSLLAAADSEDVIIIWDLASGTAAQTLTAHEREVYSVAFNADASLLVSGSRDETAIVWNLESGTAQLTIPVSDRAFAVDFHPEQNIVAIGSRDGLLYLWDVDNDAEISQITAHSGAINDLSFTPDGTQIVTASSDQQVLVWDMASGEIVQSLLGHVRLIDALAISPDGRHIVTGGDDRTIILWRLSDGEIINQYTGLERINDLAFMADNTSFIVADTTTTASRWTIERGSQFASYDNHTFEVLDVAISPDKRYIASASGNWQVHVQDRETGDISIFEAHENAVNGVAFSPDGSQIASADANGVTHVWDTATGEIAYSVMHDDNIRATSVAFTPDASYLVTAGGANRIPALFLWDTTTGDLIREFEGHLGTINSIDISPDGQILASAEEGDQAILWNIATGEILHTLSEHTNSVRDVAFNTEGTRVATVSFDQSMILWDVATGEVIREYFGHSDVIRAVDFHPESDLVFTAGSDQQVLVWDVDNEAAEPTRSYRGHTDNINALAYSADGEFFVTGARDTNVIQWRYDTLFQLKEWVEENRYIPSLSCNTQRQFRLDLDVSCEA